MALTDNINYLQPTGFKIVINRGNFGNFQYFAKQVTHPGANIAPVEVPTRRVTGVPFAGDKITYSELSMVAFVDEDLAAYNELYQWMERMVNEGHVSSGSTTNIPTYADITVITLTSANNEAAKIKYKDAIITDLGGIDFTANATTTEYLTFNASFRFSHFEII